VNAQVQKQMTREVEGIVAGQGGRGAGADRAALRAASPAASANGVISGFRGRQGQTEATHSRGPQFEFDFDEHGELLLKNQRLLLVDAKSLTELDARGVAYTRSTALQTLDKFLIELDEEDVEALTQLP